MVTFRLLWWIHNRKWSKCKMYVVDCIQILCLESAKASELTLETETKEDGWSA